MRCPKYPTINRVDAGPYEEKLAEVDVGTCESSGMGTGCKYIKNCEAYKVCKEARL